MRTLQHHRHAAALFVLLSCADLALTCHLLTRGNGRVYEANWVAAAVLEDYGVAGLVVFKFALVLLVGTLTLVIAAYRPQVARCLFSFACLAVGGVVAYSLVLWDRLEARPTALFDPAAVEKQAQDLDRLAERRRAFQEAQARWSAALAEGCVTLEEAVAALLAVERDTGSRTVSVYRQALDCASDEEPVAGVLVRGALQLLGETPSADAQARAEQLVTAYRAHFRTELLDYLLASNADLADRPPGASSASGGD